jgi:aminomethyltransferase
LTALYHEHRARGAAFFERDGWVLPSAYGNPAAEELALRETAGLLDISERGKLDLKSASLDAVLASVSLIPQLDQPPLEGGASDEVRGARGPSTPNSQLSRPHGPTSNSQGDPSFCVYRLTAEQALVVTAPAAASAILRKLQDEAAAHGCAHVTDLTSALCGLRLLGPRAPAILERLCAVDLAKESFAAGSDPWNGTVVQGAVGGVHAIIASPSLVSTGEATSQPGGATSDATSQRGYDLYVDRDLGAYLWTTLLEAGAPLGLLPVGRAAVHEV